MRSAFQTVSVCVILAITSVLADGATVARDAGYPEANGQVPSNTGTGFTVTKSWTDATSVSCRGELTFTSGAALSGQAVAVDGLDDWRGTSSGASTPNWKFRMTCKLRATCSVVNHQTGTGTYTSSAYVKLCRECLALPKADKIRQCSANKTIHNEETFLTGFAEFGDRPDLGQIDANFALDGSQLRFKFNATANGSIATSRPEVTVKSDAYVESVMAVAIEARDGNTIIDTLYQS